LIRNPIFWLSDRWKNRYCYKYEPGLVGNLKPGKPVYKQLHTFKKGAFLTAIVTGFPILPITINGSRKVLPKGRMAFKPGRIEVVVGDPIDSSVYSIDQLELLMDQTRQTIISNFDPGFDTVSSLG
jgi:1-acyl-sn-glycerol-3-phosphate acyltransferase